MKKLINLLRGYVEVQAAGAFPERLLNLCAQNRLQFWKLSWTDETSFTFRIALRDRKRLDGLARRAMCTLDERGRWGAAVVVERILAKRWGFAAGLAFCFLAVGFLSRFVLVVDVAGNETTPTAVILSQLGRAGVRPGAYGPAISELEAANDALRGLPQLSYMAINIYGTRAEVVVREAEKKPGMEDETIPADVVAEADGVIESIHAGSGHALFQDGDVVARGEVLITGDMELREPEGSAVDQGRLVVRAAGTAVARTWRTLEESMPLTARAKEYTGEERTGYGIKILWLDLDFFQNSSISDGRYDKITRTEQLALFGHALPVWVTRITLRGYTLSEQPVNREAAAAQLEQALRFRLGELMASNGGEVLASETALREEDGLLTAALTAECREDIARTVERGGRTGHIYTAPASNTKDGG